MEPTPEVEHSRGQHKRRLPVVAGLAEAGARAAVARIPLELDIIGLRLPVLRIAAGPMLPLLAEAVIRVGDASFQYGSNSIWRNPWTF